MKTEVLLRAPASLVALADEGLGAPVKTCDVAEAELLRARAKPGEAFLVESDDPRISSLHIYADEPVPEPVEQTCTARSGSFLLRVPSGQLSICGVGTASRETAEPPEVHTVEVPPGDYAVSLLDGSDKEMPAVLEQQRALVGDADWRLYQHVDNVGAIGCLAIAAGMLFVLVPYTRRELWYLLPLFLMPSVAYSFLKRLPRYRRVDEQRLEHERALPQFVISLNRVERTEGLEGGWYRCPAVDS